MAALKKQKKVVEIADGRRHDDTLRIWDRYREKGHFWRMVAIGQIPVALLALVLLLGNYFAADTIVHVPEVAQPGHYSAKLLPDSEFIYAATEVVNLVSTYTPATADKQFRTARKYLWEPALSRFEQEAINGDVRMIEETGRSQVFFVDEKSIKVERHPELDTLAIRIPGVVQKLIGRRPLPPEPMIAYLKMTTIPRNIHNEFGIVVTDMRFETRSGSKPAE